MTAANAECQLGSSVARIGIRAFICHPTKVSLDG